MIKPNDIDEYINGFSNEIQQFLEQVRGTIKKTAPQAEESSGRHGVSQPGPKITIRPWTASIPTTCGSKASELTPPIKIAATRRALAKKLSPASWEQSGAMKP